LRDASKRKRAHTASIAPLPHSKATSPFSALEPGQDISNTSCDSPSGISQQSCLGTPQMTKWLRSPTKRLRLDANEEPRFFQVRVYSEAILSRQSVVGSFDLKAEPGWMEKSNGRKVQHRNSGGSGKAPASQADDHN
jgi:hypothetical protein